MEKKGSIFGGLILVAFVATALFSSCTREEANPSKPQATNYKQEYSKRIQLFDKSGQNAVIIRVSSEDQSLVEQYSSKNFEVVPIRKGQSLNEAVQAYYGTRNEDQESLEEASEEAYVDAANISFEIISMELSEEHINIGLTFIHPEDNSLRASWKYYTHYSAAGQGLEQTASIERHSFWRRVYFGMYYKAYSWSGWSTIISPWRKLSNNDSYSANRNPSYQFKVRVKTKKSSAYTVSFEY